MSKTMIRASVFDETNDADEPEQTHVINYDDTIKRQWLSRFIHYAVTNGKFVEIEREKERDHGNP